MPRAFAREPSFEEPHEWTRVGTSIVFVHGGAAAPAAVIVDPTAGTLREITPPPPVKPAVVTTLGDRILVLPRAPAAPTPRPYLGNPSTGAWCETPWITDAPFVDNGASPYFRTVEALADGGRCCGVRDRRVPATSRACSTDRGTACGDGRLGAMTRIVWFVVALAACGKKPDPGAQTGSSGSAEDSSKAGEPTAPPPAATIKPGKGDCKPEYAPRPTRDPNPMCKVDGGTLQMGSAADGMTVKLSPYLIDQFEVTNAQVVHYLNATKAERCGEKPCFRLGHEDPAVATANAMFVHKRPDGTYAVVAGFDRLPYDDATREGALAYCTWAGKTLPTEPQWELAARRDPATGKDLAYPWGDEFDGKRARCLRDLCPMPPLAAGERSDNRAAPVGSYDGTNGFGDGRSPWGLHDMAGNAAELVADCAGPYRACDGGTCEDPPPRGTKSDGTCEQVARGGGINGEHQLKTTSHQTPMSAGFRCAMRHP